MCGKVMRNHNLKKHLSSKYINDYKVLQHGDTNLKSDKLSGNTQGGVPKGYDFRFSFPFFQNFRFPPIVTIDFHFRVDPNLSSYQCRNAIHQCNTPYF